MRLLIVEDSEEEREHLRLILTRAGNDVTAVESGRQAIEIIERGKREGRKFDLIITDYRMNPMNGIDLVVYVKTNNHGTIWLVSGYLRPETEQKARELGADKVIWKTNLEHELIKAKIIGES
jgi:CheY-like chemotaxis protein